MTSEIVKPKLPLQALVTPSFETN